MSEKKDYFDYVENVLGVKSIMLSPKQNIPLLIAVENYTDYSTDENELLQKMIAALKVDSKNISLVDLTEEGGFQPEFTLFLMNQPHDKQAAENSVTTFSPRALLKKAELKKSAWSDLQKVITYFNPAR